MNTFDFLKPLIRKTDSKIVLFVCDGLGGLPKNGKTELETANTPSMDELASRSELGQLIPVIPGITPGSGPGHLGLFGYDPVEYQIGRGVLSALGVEFPIQPGDLGVRINFATLDADGNVADRRAGRIPTEENIRLLEKLKQIEMPEVEIHLLTEKEYRAVLVLRCAGLSSDLTDRDPQVTGVPPKVMKPNSSAAEKSAVLLNAFAERATEILKEEQANTVLMRGFAVYEPLPTFEEVYGLNAAAIASYPMYRGLGKLVGMSTFAVEGSLAEEIDQIEKIWDEYDFFFVHFKYTDSTGEDGDFDAKVKRTEEADRAVSRILDLGPDVLAITGDHSTPSNMMSHSWHPIPILVHSKNGRHKTVSGFGETECSMGTFGTIQTKELMPLLLAHADKLNKFGA